LLERGAPKSVLGGLYRAMPDLQLLEHPEAGRLVWFGRDASNGRICLDPRTGRIVYVIYMTRGTFDGQPHWIGSAGLVNSSIEQFSASVRAILKRFPFDTVSLRGDDLSESEHDQLWAEFDRAIEELEQTLGEIDHAAVADPDCYWMSFLADVQM